MENVALHDTRGQKLSPKKSTYSTWEWLVLGGIDFPGNNPKVLTVSFYLTT